MRLSQDRLFIFDTETTGVDVSADRVIEFGAVIFEAGEVVSQHRLLINPEQPIPEEASQVHHIYDEHVRTAPTFTEVGPRIAAWMDGTAEDTLPPVLSGYNAAQYDAAILNAEFARIGHPERIDPAEVLDPVIFVRWHLRHHRSRRLEHMCEHFGIHLRNAHSAAADATATGRLLLRMIEAGYIPDDLEDALQLQARYAEAQAAEWTEWMYWLYRDRQDSEVIRLGAGRHIGRALSEVDPGYLQSLLARIPDLPPGVRRLFEIPEDTLPPGLEALAEDEVPFTLPLFGT